MINAIKTNNTKAIYQTWVGPIFEKYYAEDNGMNNQIHRIDLLY